MGLNYAFIHFITHHIEGMLFPLSCNTVGVTKASPNKIKNYCTEL